MPRPEDAPDDTTLPDGVRALALEDALVRLEGVDAVRVVPDADDGLEEIHLVVSPGASVKAVVQSARELVEERAGASLPTDAIHVTKRPDEHETTSSDRAPLVGRTDRERVVLDSVQLVMRGHGTTVGVHLWQDERQLRGDAGPVGPSAVLRSVAEATIIALGEIAVHRLDLVSAEVVDAGVERVALVTVVASDGRVREQLSGSAMVRGNDADAVARAVLDATNRLRQVAPA